MFKASSIYEMENFLLSKSSTDDFVFSANKRGVPDGVLSADDIRRDVAIFARLLIRVYVGWPVHDEITKMRILKHLINVYNDAHEISAGEFFKLLKPVVADIPDNHISIRFGTIRFGTKYKKPYKNVGKNIAGNKIVRGEMRDGGVAAIGFSAMIKSDEFKNAIVDFAKNILPESNALIMDLRGNTGGNSWYSDLFAEHLCGAWIDSFKTVYVRTNCDAQKFLSTVYPTAPWAKLPESEELVVWKTGKNYTPDINKAYMKPIYILTDRQTASSAEMFLLRMLHHPCTVVVGDNSSGTEVFGNVGSALLPSSQIKFNIGMNYRVLSQENFELNGVTPNIKCPENTDALTVALREIANQQILSQAIKQNSNAL